MTSKERGKVSGLLVKIMAHFKKRKKEKIRMMTPKSFFLNKQSKALLRLKERVFSLSLSLLSSRRQPRVVDPSHDLVQHPSFHPVDRQLVHPVHAAVFDFLIF